MGQISNPIFNGWTHTLISVLLLPATLQKHHLCVCVCVCVLCRKSARKINFLQFKDALQHLADKKYPSERDSLHVLTTKIMGGKGPSISGTTVNYDS